MKLSIQVLNNTYTLLLLHSIETSRKAGGYLLSSKECTFPFLLPSALRLGLSGLFRCLITI